MATSEGFALALTAAMTVGKQGSHFADISASLLPIVDGRHAHLFFKEGAKSRGVGKVKIVGYLFNAFIGRGYQEDGFLDDGFEHQLLHRVARYRLHQRGEIFG